MHCAGEPELCYWQKAAADRQKKHNSKNPRPVKRGRDKVFNDICIIYVNSKLHYSYVTGS